LSMKQRRELGLYTINRTGMKYCIRNLKNFIVYGKST
jgi:hypothetical protein